MRANVPPPGQAYESECSTTFKNAFVVGTLRAECIHCTPLKCPHDSAGMCCSNGKIDLRPIPQPAQSLAALFAGNSESSRHFKMIYSNRVVPFSSLPLTARK